MPGQMVSTQNYLVPANGKTGAYVYRDTLIPGTPVTIDFRTLNLDGQNFWPYGIYVDNRDGASDCYVTFDQLDITHTTLAGTLNIFNYPGVVDQTVTFEGDGMVRLIFVNYPIIG